MQILSAAFVVRPTEWPRLGVCGPRETLVHVPRAPGVCSPQSVSGQLHPGSNHEFTGVDISVRSVSVSVCVCACTGVRDVGTVCGVLGLRPSEKWKGSSWRLVGSHL